jgi:hypothetical protein
MQSVAAPPHPAANHVKWWLRTRAINADFTNLNKTTMKAIKLFTIACAVIIIFLAGFVSGRQSAQRPWYEYQLILEDDFMHIENNGRYVGSVPYGNTAIDSLFIKDNE